jgi:hypothetical protein
MSDELKPQSIDTLEFRDLLWDIVRTAGNERVIRDVIAHIDAWGARLAGQAAKDAERYRWLRDEARAGWDERLFVTDDGHKDYYEANGLYEAELDAEVDKAMDAERKEPPCGS